MHNETPATLLPYVQLDELGRVREIGFRGGDAFERLRRHYRLPPLKILLGAQDGAWLTRGGRPARPLPDDFSPRVHTREPHADTPRAFRVSHDHYLLTYVRLTPGHDLAIQPDREERPSAKTPAAELSFLLRTRSAKDDFNWTLLESDLFDKNDLLEVLLPGDQRNAGDDKPPSRVHKVGELRRLLEPIGDLLRSQRDAAIAAEEAELLSEKLGRELAGKAEKIFSRLPQGRVRATNPRDTLMRRVRRGSTS